MDFQKYWHDVLIQDKIALKTHFTADAFINWHNTNEHFSADEFIAANCQYPGSWDGKIERIEQGEGMTITVTHVWSKESGLSFHVTSFIRLDGDKISAVDEYWGDDGPAPQWRQDMKIGSPIAPAADVPRCLSNNKTGKG